MAAAEFQQEVNISHLTKQRDGPELTFPSTPAKRTPSNVLRAFPVLRGNLSFHLNSYVFCIHLLSVRFSRSKNGLNNIYFCSAISS